MATTTEMHSEPTTPPTRTLGQLQDLSTIESLLLAQSVYEHGASAWQSVSKALSKHPALTRPKNFFSPSSCQQIYAHLMTEASLECSEANNVPHAPCNLTLARRHYSARLVQLRDMIAAEEVEFKHVVNEIDEIRNGAWDDRIRTKLSAKDDGSLTDGADAQPTAHPTELQQDTEEHVAPTNNQDGPTQPPDGTDTDARDIDDSTEGPIDLSLRDPSVDTEVVEATPSAGDEAQEELIPAVDAPPEDSTYDMCSTEIKPLHETAEMDIDKSISPRESEEKASEKLQQREGKRKVTDIDHLDENIREKKRLRDESTSIDVDEQASTSRRTTANNELLLSHQQTPPSVPNKRFQIVIGMLHSQISQHRNGNIFHNPIKNSEAPDYHDIIKRPMDLKTIKGRVKDGFISNSLEFQRDVYLMFANAMMYNRPGSDIYQMAEEMMSESEVHINTFRQTEGFVRSTRS